MNISEKDTPTLLAHLITRYEIDLNSKVTSGDSELTATDVSEHMEEMSKFIRWAEKYLDNNRPVQVLHGTTHNYELVLSNNVRVLIAPNIAIAGTMAGGPSAIPMSRPEVVDAERRSARMSGTKPGFESTLSNQNTNFKTQTANVDMRVAGSKLR